MTDQTLFDVSPTEDQATRKKAARPKRAAEKPSDTDSGTFVPPVSFSAKPFLPLGKLDHTYACPSPRCQAECHDILVEDDGDWMVECCFCGTRQWVRIIKGHLKPKAEQFKFPNGICQGLTIDEAAATTNGMDYVEWAAQSHKWESVRAACKSWLDSRKAAS